MVEDCEGLSSFYAVLGRGPGQTGPSRRDRYRCGTYGEVNGAKSSTLPCLRVERVG